MSAARELFEYAVIRVVPRVERGELVNVGVVLYCQSRDYLAARTALDPDRLRALDPGVDLGEVRAALSAWETTCVGGSGGATGGSSGDGSRGGSGGGSDGVADGGPAARLRLGERFRWLTAPRSTIIQTGPVHTGLTTDPDAELTRLLDLLVR